jgi:hypothetical protein
VPGRPTRARRGAGTNRALGLSNELFVLGDSVVLTVLSQVAFMPVLVLAARLCPEVCPRPPSTLPVRLCAAPSDMAAFACPILACVCTTQWQGEMPVLATVCTQGLEGFQVIGMKLRVT